MAKLSTTLSLYDNFSNKLNKINSTLQNTGSKVGKFGGLFNQSVGTKLFGSVQAGFQATDGAMSNMTSGFSAKMGIISGIAQSVTSSVIGSVRSMSSEIMGELAASSATWQTFEGNMAIFGKSKKEIAGVKKELQAFAEQTIYSSSDMASTYAQLAAVGTENTLDLVKGFGGLASAAESPQQAMKTLSQQATQMASKPKVQWEDFKLILEQTPAGIAAVAKSMGMSTSEIVTAVQDGKIATKDFFDAIAETGTSDGFTEMATKFKTVGQAMDGLSEGLTNKMQPAFDKASEYGISFVSKLAERIESVNFSGLLEWIEKIAPKVEEGMLSAIDTIAEFVPKMVGFISSGFSIAKNLALEFWEGFTSTGALDGIESAMSAIGDAFGNIKGNLPTDTGFIEKLGELAGTGISAIATMIKDFATSISKLSPDQIASIGESIGLIIQTFALFKYGKSALFASVIGLIAKGISKLEPYQMELVARGISGIVGAFAAFKLASGALSVFGAIKGLFGGAGEPLPGGKGGPTEQVKGLSDGLNSLAKSAGIALIIGSLAGLALALKPLASLGSTAVAPLVTFGLVVAGLATVLSAVGTKLSASAVSIAVFAGAVSVLALAMAVVASTGEYGARNMIVFGLVIGGLVAVFALFGQMLNLAIPGMLAFGLTMLMVGAAMLLATPAILALPPLVEAIGVAFVAVAGAIAGAVVEILGAVGNLVTQVADGMTQVITAIGDSITNVVDSVSGLIAEIGDSLSQVIETISTGIIGVTDAVSGGITDVVDAVGGAISGVLDSVAGIFESIGSAALDAGTGMEKMAGAFERIGAMGAWDLGKTIGAIASALKDLSANGEALQVASGAVAQLATSLAIIATTAAGLETFSLALLSIAASMAVTNEDFVLFAATLQTLYGAVALAVGPMLLFSTSAMSASAGVMILGNATANVLSQVTAFNSGLLTLIATLATIVTAYQKGATDIDTAMTQAMTNSTSAVTDGMSATVSAIDTGMTTAVQSARTGATGIVSEFMGLQSLLYSTGLYAMAGLTGGIRSGAGNAIAAAQSVASQVSSTIRKALDIHSPSRVMIEIGGFVTQGLANGILSARKMVEKATATIAVAAKPDFSKNEGSPETGFTSSVFVDDEDLARLRASADQTVTIKNRQVTPQVSIVVHNQSDEPIDEDALLDKFETKIIELMDSDLD